MGNLQCLKLQKKNTINLSEQAFNKVNEVFNYIDKDLSQQIDKNEITQLWKGKFAKINAENFYQALDLDNNGYFQQCKRLISLNEWIQYWQLVRQSGYTDDDIIFEVQYQQFKLEQLVQGGSWCNFNLKKNKILNSPKMRKKSKTSELKDEHL